MHNHRPRLQPDSRKMRMPGHNVHEILQLDPAHILKSEELGPRFIVERDSIVPRDV